MFIFTAMQFKEFYLTIAFKSNHLWFSSYSCILSFNMTVHYYLIQTLWTDLCSLIGNFHTVDIPKYGNSAIFLSLWFYVKLILADFRRSKTVILTILEALNSDFLRIHTWKCQKYQKVQNSELLKWSKWHFWGFKMTKIDFTLNLSGRKILKFSHCLFSIMLPRSVLTGQNMSI